ncbi:TPA: hypothetical protein TY878_001305 [Streptococcus suis]|nr:hypothetical protein [Streptococcus suis]HEL2100770.1 hypothetical protein [Streptococcus suis]
MVVPKFRAFYEDKMYGVKAVIWTSRGLYVTLDEGNKIGRRVRGAKVMRSTGLFDKNGKEIFEGDIIVAMSQGAKAIGEVKRRIDGYWLMYPFWQHGELWHIVENVDTGETGVEVIGNIYENPELVEEVTND